MMTDEDLREQKGRGSNRKRIEVQERLSGRSRGGCVQVLGA